MKFPTIEEMARNVAEKALDEYEYNGKTLREWMEIIETASEDTISRRAAIEALTSKYDEFNRKDDYMTALKTIRDELPPMTYTKINPPSDYARQFGLIPKEDATKDSTNLAEVGTDAISRQQAIDALKQQADTMSRWSERYAEQRKGVLTAVNIVEDLPPIQLVIAPCDYAKACNEATMDKLTSAVAYYDVLEELRKQGYVLVDMREVTT